MDIHSLFNIRTGQARTETVPGAPARKYGPELAGKETAPVPEGTTPADASTSKTLGAFVTPQTFVSFSVATGVISGTFNALKSLVPAVEFWKAWGNPSLFGISLLVGFLIYWINISDKDARYSLSDKIIGAVMAFFNTIVLYNASRSILGLL